MANDNRVGVTHDDISALEFGTNRRGMPRPFLPSRGFTLPITPDQVRRAVERSPRRAAAADLERKIASYGEGDQ